MPLPCVTGVRGLHINNMRVLVPIATGTCYHVNVRRYHAASRSKSQGCPRHEHGYRPLLRAQIANHQTMERQPLGMDAQPEPGVATDSGLTDDLPG